jgi:hypothetical protein
VAPCTRRLLTNDERRGRCPRRSRRRSVLRYEAIS